MKRKALKIKLLFILFTISCLSAFSQGVNKNVREIWFPALKAQTGGDNWTIKSWAELLGRNSTPFFEKGKENSANQQDVPTGDQRRPSTLTIVDLRNNNLVGVIDNDDQETWTYLDPRASNKEKGRFFRTTSFRFSHNKLTTVRVKIVYSDDKAQDLWFDHNLLTTFEPKTSSTLAGNGASGAQKSVRINNNQLKGIPASWVGGSSRGTIVVFISWIPKWRNFAQRTISLTLLI